MTSKEKKRQKIDRLTRVAMGKKYPAKRVPVKKTAPTPKNPLTAEQIMKRKISELQRRQSKGSKFID